MSKTVKLSDFERTVPVIEAIESICELLENLMAKISALPLSCGGQHSPNTRILHPCEPAAIGFLIAASPAP